MNKLVKEIIKAESYDYEKSCKMIEALAYTLDSNGLHAMSNDLIDALEDIFVEDGICPHCASELTYKARTTKIEAWGKEELLLENHYYCNDCGFSI